MKTFIKPNSRYIPVVVLKDYRPEFPAVRVKKEGKAEEWIVRPDEIITEAQIEAEIKAKQEQEEAIRKHGAVTLPKPEGAQA